MCHFLAPAGQPEMMHKNFMHEHLRIFVVQCSCMKFYGPETSCHCEAVRTARAKSRLRRLRSAQRCGARLPWQSPGCLDCLKASPRPLLTPSRLRRATPPHTGRDFSLVRFFTIQPGRAVTGLRINSSVTRSACATFPAREGKAPCGRKIATPGKRTGKAMTKEGSLRAGLLLTLPFVIPRQ